MEKGQLILDIIKSYGNFFGMAEQTPQNLYEDMELRYGAAFTQDVRDRLEQLQAREIQYFEMKQMIEIMFRYRERVRAFVVQYRAWKRDYDLETDMIEKVYKGYEGLFLRRQLKDVWQLYLMANRDYHDMYRTYMDQITNKKSEVFQTPDYLSSSNFSKRAA